MLLNFQSNAIKFVGIGGSITIRCSLIRVNDIDSGTISVSVIDNGIGISPEDQQRLFKLFGNVENCRNDLNSKGVGLGLYISKMIVQQFNGQVDVQSQPSAGSNFTFSFKLSPP